MQKKMGIPDSLLRNKEFHIRNKEFHDKVVDAIYSRRHTFLDELGMDGKILFTEKEPKAFEEQGRRVDIIFVVRGKDLREDHEEREEHFVTIYQLIFVEVKVGRWQKRTGIKQLRAWRDFLVANENWKTWLNERIPKLEGREVWLYPRLLRVRKSDSWKDMVCDLSRHNLPEKTRLGRYSSSVKTIAEGARGAEEVRRMILDGKEEE